MRKGFTLVEFLVVVAMITVGVAILGGSGPAGRNRPRARQSICMNNLKAIQLAILSYTQDYDEIMPINGTGLTIYTKSPQMFKCPSSTSKFGYALGANMAGLNIAKACKNDAFQPCEQVTTWELNSDTSCLNAEIHNFGADLGYLDGHAKWHTNSDAFETDTKGIRHLAVPGVSRAAQGIGMYPLIGSENSVTYTIRTSQGRVF